MLIPSFHFVLTFKSNLAASGHLGNYIFIRLGFGAVCLFFMCLNMQFANVWPKVSYLLWYIRYFGLDSSHFVSLATILDSGFQKFCPHLREEVPGFFLFTQPSLMTEQQKIQVYIIDHRLYGFCISLSQTTVFVTVLQQTSCLDIFRQRWVLASLASLGYIIYIIHDVRDHDLAYCFCVMAAYMLYHLRHWKETWLDMVLANQYD